MNKKKMSRNGAKEDDERQRAMRVDGIWCSIRDSDPHFIFFTSLIVVDVQVSSWYSWMRIS